MADILQALLLYFSLLAGAGALVSGEIVALDLMFPPPALDLAEARR